MSTRKVSPLILVCMVCIQASTQKTNQKKTLGDKYVYISRRIRKDGRTEVMKTESQMTENRNKRMNSLDAQTKYLEKYGYYIDDRDSQIDKEKRFISALKRFQKRFGLQPTGEVDRDTMSLMETPRCGVPDILKRRAKRYGVISRAWASKKFLTYRVLQYSKDLPRSVQDKAFERGFQAVSKVTNLKFVRIKKYADIEISFGVGPHGDKYPFDGIDGVLAHAYSPGKGKGGDVHIDDAETWRNIDMLSYAFTHELLHGLGLHHSNVKGSLMEPYLDIWGDCKWNLHQDDIDGLQDIYGAKTSPPTTPITTTTIRTTTRPEEVTLPPTRKTTTTTTTTPEEVTLPPTRKTTTTTPTTVTTTRVTTKRKTTKRRTTTTTTISPSRNPLVAVTVPNKQLTSACSDGGEIDAIDVDSAGFIHIFKQKNYIFLDQIGHIFFMNPIKQVFPKLPHKVDAMLWLPALEKGCGTSSAKSSGTSSGTNDCEDKQLYVFSKHDYFMFFDGYLTPYTLMETGRISDKFPGVPSPIDAAFTCGKTGTICFIQRDNMWQFNRRLKTTRTRDPKSFARFHLGAPKGGIDAAFRVQNGLYYFFSKEKYFIADKKHSIYTFAGIIKVLSRTGSVAKKFFNNCI